jgi:hypothetical protein
MCKGTVKEKALFLFDIIVGPKSIEQNDSIACSSSRMKKAFKMMLFFSEVFPKKF